MRFSGNYMNSSNRIFTDLLFDLCDKVVTKYVLRGVIPSREKEDVMMAVMEKFIKQKEKIDKAFEGKSKVATYYVAIISRMCCEIIRKEQRHWYAVVDDEEKMDEYREPSMISYESEKKVHISDELNRFKTTMLFFNGTRAKVYLFLKYYFNIPLNDQDIEAYYRENPSEIKNLLLPEPSSKAELFNNLSMAVRLVEKKNVGGDAVRMWLNKQIDIILNRLNLNGVYAHNKDSLGALMELQNKT